MDKRQANQQAHYLIYMRIQGLLDDVDREDLPQADIARIDEALERWAHWHFERSRATTLPPIVVVRLAAVSDYEVNGCHNHLPTN